MKYSIKRQMLALFTGAVALVIVMMFIINSSFMERFFIQNKKIEMVELYETLDKTAKKGDINSVEIQEELQRQCERKNCAVLVINSGSDITFNTEQERKGRLFTRLIGYIVGKYTRSRIRDEEKNIWIWSDSWLTSLFLLSEVLMEVFTIP